MADGPRTVRHRRFTQLARQLREHAELTRDQVTAHMEWNSSKVAKLETGRWSFLSAQEVRALVALYGVTDQAEQDAYVQLARDAKQRGWWQPYSDMVGDYVALEDEASSIRTFEPQYIPGLLQTEDYARALIRSNPANHPDEVERRVMLRLERQKLLERPAPPQLRAVVDEAAIHRPVGDGDVMRAQLHYLAQLDARHVAVQVLPITVGAHPGMEGSFVLLHFTNPADHPVVHLETATDGLYLEDAEMIQRYTLMYDYLQMMALGPDQTRQVLRDAAARL